MDPSSRAESCERRCRSASPVAKASSSTVTGSRFTTRSARPASPAEVADWLTSIRPERATPSIGDLLLAPGVPAALDAGGFDRHTFLGGQSGSGKTYSLGLVLERSSSRPGSASSFSTRTPTTSASAASARAWTSSPRPPMPRLRRTSSCDVPGTASGSGSASSSRAPARPRSGSIRSPTARSSRSSTSCSARTA